MSLATRCFACGTVFRVVQDQLKVSEGWVRCGRCNEVFNALESLFDLERDSPPEWSPVEPAMGGAAGFGSEASRDEPVADPSLVNRIDAHLLGTRRREQSSTPATRVDERDRLEFPDAEFAPDSASELIAPIHDTTLPFSGTSDHAAAPNAPEFVRHAQRRERWNRPAARAALFVVCLLSAALLTLQVGHHFRDTIAMRWPETKPALVAWCAALGCTIQPPRRIDDIAVENTALTRTADADAFSLAVTLRNRGAMALALPSIDLSLTDATGQLVARRMLAPNEWRASAPNIPAGAELPLRLPLTTGSARVTGYTVEIFYP